MDSKELWLGIRQNLTKFDLRLGVATAQGYVSDPRLIAFVAARYKFVAKMLEGKGKVLELGCGDAFGAPIVAQSVGRLICTDIDEETLSENETRCSVFKNIDFVYADFREKPFDEQCDAIFSVDVIEHIFQEEEDRLMHNLSASLNPEGVMLIGTPNVNAEKYASENSRAGHVNLKDQSALKELGLRYFHNVFMFSMNDEVVHTGYAPMSHYIWALCVGQKVI